MKKAYSMLMVLMLVVGVLAACGPDREKETGGSKEESGSTNKPEKLLIWEDTDKGVGLEPAIKAFEKEHGIKVEYKERGKVQCKSALGSFPFEISLRSSPSCDKRP